MISIISCTKKDNTPIPTKIDVGISNVDSTKVKPIIDSAKNKPVIKFSYELLENGSIKFTNLSKDFKSLKWYAPYKSKSENPIFLFEKNGKYTFLLSLENELGYRADSTFNINITNVTQYLKVDSSVLSGVLFDKNILLKSKQSNNFYGVGLASFPLGTPTSQFNSQAVNIVIADFMPTQGINYSTVKNNFKVGKQSLAILNEYPTSNYSLKQRGWYAYFSGENGFFATDNNSELEILEVEEVNQPKLFPEMYDKAFWVTWKIKINTPKGKIDCTLKMKYLIYEQYFDF